MKEKEVVTILNRIAADFTELAALLQDSSKTDKKDAPVKKAKEAKVTGVKEEKAEAPEAAPAEEIGFEEVRSTLAEKAANGCRQQVKDLLKEYSLSCLSDIEAHPELFAEILTKARAM